VQGTFGQRPKEPGQRAAWDAGVRAAARYRFAYEIKSETDPLGRPPEQSDQRQQWQRALNATERSLRTLGRDPQPRLETSHDINLEPDR